MSKIVAGAVILPGECGEDDITSANLDQMATTLETRPPTDDDRRELVEILRWLAKLVRELEGGCAPPSERGRRADANEGRRLGPPSGRE